MERASKKLTKEVVKLMGNFSVGKISNSKKENLRKVLLNSVKGARKEKTDKVVIEKLMEFLEFIKGAI